MAALMRMPEIAALAGVQPVTIRKYRSMGRFPAPDRIVDLASGKPCPLWTRGTVERWMAERAERGRATPVPA